MKRKLFPIIEVSGLVLVNAVFMKWQYEINLNKPQSYLIVRYLFILVNVSLGLGTVFSIARLVYLVFNTSKYVKKIILLRLSSFLAFLVMDAFFVYILASVSDDGFDFMQRNFGQFSSLQKMYITMSIFSVPVFFYLFVVAYELTHNYIKSETQLSDHLIEH